MFQCLRLRRQLRPLPCCGRAVGQLTRLLARDAEADARRARHRRSAPPTDRRCNVRRQRGHPHLRLGRIDRVPVGGGPLLPLGHPRRARGSVNGGEDGRPGGKGHLLLEGDALGAPHRAVSFTVPTGNFGDIFAGYIAQKMGLPIKDLVVATNQNDILHRTLETGAYTKQGVTPTISPSMDIQVSSNFERALFDAYGRDGDAVATQMDDLKSGGFKISQGAYQYLRDTFKSGRASEAETSAAISTYLAQHGELLCPHSAVGVHVAQDHLGATPMVTLATAHPAKFPAAVDAASGAKPPLPPRMAGLYDRDERVTRVACDFDVVSSLIKERIDL